MSAYENVRDAITVLTNMRVTTEPMRPDEMGDIEQRRVTALGYLNSAVAPVYVAEVRAAAGSGERHNEDLKLAGRQLACVIRLALGAGVTAEEVDAALAKLTPIEKWCDCDAGEFAPPSLPPARPPTPPSTASPGAA